MTCATSGEIRCREDGCGSLRAPTPVLGLSKRRSHGGSASRALDSERQGFDFLRLRSERANLGRRTSRHWGLHDAHGPRGPPLSVPRIADITLRLYGGCGGKGPGLGMTTTKGVEFDLGDRLHEARISAFAALDIEIAVLVVQ